MPVFDVLPTTGLDTEDHQTHQEVLHQIVTLPVNDDVGAVAMAEGTNVVSSRRADYLPFAAVVPVSHTVAGPIIINLDPAKKIYRVVVSADISGIVVNNDDGHGEMADIWIVLVFAADAAVSLGGIPELVTIVPSETSVAGGVWPMRWISFPSGTGTTVGGGTSTTTGTITGAVARETQGPAGGAPIDLLTSGTVISSTVSDSNGQFQFSNLAPGFYDVQITAPAGSTFADGATTSETTTVEVEAGGFHQVYAELADLAGGGSPPVLSANSATWEWTTTDPLAPALVTLTATSPGGLSNWLWSTRRDGGSWSTMVDPATAAPYAQPVFDVYLEAKDPQGGLLYGLDTTVYEEIAVSDDGGATWSAVQEMTLIFRT